MTNSTEFSQNASYKMPFTETLSPDSTTHKVELTHDPVATSISIPYPKATPSDSGLMEGTTAQQVAAGKFKLTPAAGAQKATLEFNAADIADTVTISYEYVVTAEEAIIDNRSSAIGEAVLVYPVYGDASGCDIQSSIIGHVVMRVYKARVTAQPGLDGSLTYRFPAQ